MQRLELLRTLEAIFILLYFSINIYTDRLINFFTAHAYWWLIVAPNGTRDTKISDEKNQIKLRKKITKKRCEKVFTSYPKQLFDIYCLIIFFLTVRIIVHEVLFINVSHHHGLLYYSFVLSTNKINTAQILLQIFFYKNNMIIYTRSYRFLFFIIRI